MTVLCMPWVFYLKSTPACLEMKRTKSIPWPCFPTIKKRVISLVIAGNILTPNFCSHNFCSPWNQQGLLQVPLKGHLVKGLKMMEFPTCSLMLLGDHMAKPCLTGGCTELHSWSWTPWKKGAWKTILFAWNGPPLGLFQHTELEHTPSNL